MLGGRDGCCSPAIAELDANVAGAVQLLAIFEPAVGGQGVSGHCLTLQRLLLPHLSRLALHLLQLGPGGCGGIRQGGEHGDDGAVSSMSSGGRATGLGLGLGSRLSRCHFLGQFDKHSAMMSVWLLRMESFLHAWMVLGALHTLSYENHPMSSLQ